MKKIISTLIFSLIVLSACQPATVPQANSTIQGVTSLPRVLVTETFLADIAKNVAGDRLKVESLIPVGMDPHGFEPTPKDVAKITDSQILILNGAGFETWLDPILENAGSTGVMIEAAAGLTSREAREGEEAVMSDAELAEAMCASAGESQVMPATAGPERSTAEELPEESGLFGVQLSPTAGGTFAGFLRYATDEAGDFQIVSSAGSVTVLDGVTSAEVDVEKKLPLDCHGLSEGRIVELEKDGQYILALSDFVLIDAQLLIGPAGGHHHHQGDPHFWLDPNNVISYVENIRDGLIQVDPAGKDIYTKNAELYIIQLRELDAWIVEQVKQIPPERRLLVTNHESFGYFADRYGFRVIGTILPSVSTGASPSAQQLARLVDHIRAAGAPAIFLETGSSPQLAEQVARETGVKVVTELYSHSITGPDGEAPSYIAMMRFNVNAIVAALK